MNYKVGDKVRVKSLEWYNANKNEYGDVKCYDCQETDIKCQDTIYFISLMAEYCGTIVTIDKIWEDYSYSIIEDEHKFDWTDDMFEGLVESNELNKVQDNEQTFKAVDDVDYVKPVVFENIVFPNENYADKVELCLGDVYEIVVEDGRTFVQRKKPKYPTTYEECCEVLDADPSRIIVLSNNKNIIHEENNYCYEMYNLYQLLICRDAYWKIAGEQMGLGKSWRPDYVSLVNNEYFTIHTFNNEIIKSGTSHRNAILAFPTAEMRDTFYENFKDLIEKCKELL